MMTREDYIWVAIRVFGIYLLVLAITAVPSLLSSAYATWVFWDFAPQTEAPSELVPFAALESKLADTYLSQLIKSAGRVALFLVAGWYFLCRGAFVFSLVGKRMPLSPPREPPSG